MNPLPIPSVLAAEYLVAYASSKGASINVTQLQKLLYMAYGFALKQNIRLVEEHPKAWPYGPVFPRTRKLVDISSPLSVADGKFDAVDEDRKQLLNKIFDEFGAHSAGKLSSWSHKEDGPWYKTTKLPGFEWNTEIPDEFIKEYFDQYEL